MSIKNAVLRVSAMGNRIYLGTVSAKNRNIMNDSKVDFTMECVHAVIQHMQGLPEGKDCYQGSEGRLVWEPKKEEQTCKQQA